MLAHKNRFRGKSSVSVMYKTSTIVRASDAHLRFRDKKASDFRVAVVVSKKTSKSAVVRNRIRRRVYEWVRLHRQYHGSDLLITIFEESFAKMPYSSFDAKMQHLFDKNQNKRPKQKYN